MSLRFFIFFGGWPTLFGIWLLTEPYGRNFSGYEKEKAFEIFIMGLLLWAIGCIILTKLHPHTRTLTTPIKMKAQGYFTERMKNEINEYITALRGADDDEVGLALVAAIHFRNIYLYRTDIDLFDPALALVSDPGLALKFSKEIEECQAENRNIDAVPLLVWAHSLRAIQNPQIRALGREMWGELQRGKKHALKKSEDFELIIGRRVDLTGLDDVPEGLSPRKSNQSENSTKSLSNSEQEEELLRIKSLFEKGLLTQEVYEEKQRKILD